MTEEGHSPSCANETAGTGPGRPIVATGAFHRAKEQISPDLKDICSLHDTSILAYQAHQKLLPNLFLFYFFSFSETESATGFHIHITFKDETSKRMLTFEEAHQKLNSVLCHLRPLFAGSVMR